MRTALPSVDLCINGVRHAALVDSGCSQCVCEVSCCDQWQRWNINLQTINGQMMPCLGTGRVRLGVPDFGEVTVDVIVVGKNPLGYRFILGMNGIEALGGRVYSES